MRFPFCSIVSPSRARDSGLYVLYDEKKSAAVRGQREALVLLTEQRDIAISSKKARVTIEFAISPVVFFQNDGRCRGYADSTDGNHSDPNSGKAADQTRSLTDKLNAFACRQARSPRRCLRWCRLANLR